MGSSKIKAFTFEFVYNYFKEHGCQLLSTEYHNNHEYLDYICSCGNPSQIPFSNFKKGHRCMKCKKDRIREKKKNKKKEPKHSFEFVYNYFLHRNCQLLSKEYVDDRQKLEFICSCGNHDFISFNALKRGELCKKCSSKINLKYTPYTYDFVQYYFNTRDMVLLTSEEEYKNGGTILKYVCSCGNVSNIRYAVFHYIKQECNECSVTRRKGENSYLWEGGLTPLHIYLRRSSILEWKKDSMKESNYKCILTGKSFDDIHHLYSFNKIIKEVLDEVNLPIKNIDGTNIYYNNIDTYTEEELKLIEQKCLELHYKYGLGVCLNRELHKLFHEEYNYDNRPEQFEEFKQRLKSGEFDDYLKHYDIKLII